MVLFDTYFWLTILTYSWIKQAFIIEFTVSFILPLIVPCKFGSPIYAKVYRVNLLFMSNKAYK